MARWNVCFYCDRQIPQDLDVLGTDDEHYHEECAIECGVHPDDESEGVSGDDYDNESR